MPPCRPLTEHFVTERVKVARRESGCTHADAGVDTRPSWWLLVPPQSTKSKRVHIGLSSRHISRTQSFQENCPFIFQVRVVLKTLVSLMGRLVACSARIAAETDRQTRTRTYTHAEPSLRMRAEG